MILGDAGVLDFQNTGRYTWDNMMWLYDCSKGISAASLKGCLEGCRSRQRAVTEL